jgi:hypothetical protein
LVINLKRRNAFALVVASSMHCRFAVAASEISAPFLHTSAVNRKPMQHMLPAP